MSDSLLAAAGMLSPSVAGTALALDYMEEEQKRQMTIKAANVSLLHEKDGKPYVINLIDTPGHVDFSGRVTRSLRAIDGAVVVVDAVEEVMVQTETVTRQAVEVRVRPVLYINKIDRLIKELKLTAEQIQERVARIIKDFNGLIELYAEPEFREKWKVNFATNTVAMGSAKDRWGFTSEIARTKGITGFMAYVLSSNKRMLSVFNSVDFIVHSVLDEGIYEISFRFDEPALTCLTEECS
jgi:elongation factor 2